MRRLATWPARHPLAALCLAGAAAVLSVLAISRIRLDTSLESMISHDDPAAVAAVRVLNEFSAAEELLVMATVPQARRTDPPDALPLLEFAERMERSIRGDTNASSLCARITWRADAQTRRYIEQVIAPSAIYYLDDASFEAARRRLTYSQMVEQIGRSETMMAAPGPAAAAIAKAFVKDPLRLHEFLMDRISAGRPFKTWQNSDAFLSPDGCSVLIRISGNRPTSDLEFAKALTAAVRDHAARVNRGGLEIDISGSYAIAAASEHAVRSDMTFNIVSSLACVAILFAGVYRRPLQRFALDVLPVGIGIIYGFGVYSLFSSTLTPMASVIGGILTGMGIDYSIHYTAHYQASRALGLGPSEAIRHSVDIIGMPLFAAWATSVVGFAAIRLSNVQALRDFALLGSLGLSGVLAASVFVLPAVLALRDRKPSPAATMPPSRINFLSAIDWIRRHRIPSVGGCLLIMLLAGGVVVRNGGWPGMESDLSVMHPRPNPPLDSQQRIAERMGVSPGSLIVHLKADSPEELLRLSCAVQERLRMDGPRRAGIASSFGLASLLPDPDVVLRRRYAVSPAEAERLIADFRSAIAGSAFSAKAFEPYVQFLRRLLSGPEAPTVDTLLDFPELARMLLPERTIVARQPPAEAIALVFTDRPLDDASARGAAVEAIRAALGGLPGATLTGLNVVGHDMHVAVEHDLPRLTLISAGIVLMYLLIHFRSSRDAVLALLPTLFSFACTFAVMHLTGRKLNMINLVTIPLLIGIDVDYGIFVVSLVRRRGTMPRAVFDGQLASSSLAIVMCAATTVLGFGSLAFTSIPAVQSLGVAVGVGVLTCLAGTLLGLLPLMAPADDVDRRAMPERT